MFYRIIHKARRLVDPTRELLPTARLLKQLLNDQLLPSLSGDKLFIVTDTSYKHGHSYDAMICTDEAGLHRWNKRRQLVRQLYPQMPKLHYKKLSGHKTDLNWFNAYLDAVNEMQGIVAVIATPKEWIENDASIVRKAKELGMTRTAHAWSKEHVYVGLVNLASMVATVAERFVRPGMSIHWLSDTEPPFRNSLMRKDIQSAYHRALDITIPMRLKDCTLTVKEDLPSTNHWKADLFAIPDVLAGGVGDAIDALIEDPDLALVTWNPQDRNNLMQRESMVVDWFWSQQVRGPIRVGVRLEERGFNGIELKRRANWFRSPLAR